MADISINIKATDQASQNINKVAKSVDNVETQVKQAEKVTKSFGDTLSKAFFAVELLKTGFEAGKQIFDFLSQNSENFAKSMEQIQGVAKRVAEVFTQLLAPAIEGAVKFITELMKSKPFIDAVAGAFTVLSSVIKTIVDSAGRELVNIFNTIKTSFGDLFKGIGQNVDAFDILGGALQYISSAFKVVSTNIQGVIKVVASVIEAYKSVGDVISKVGKVIANPLDKQARDEFLNSVKTAGSTVLNVYKTAGEAIVASYKTVIGEIKNAGKGAKEYSEIVKKSYGEINDKVKNAVESNTAIIEDGNQKQADSTQKNIDKQITAWEKLQSGIKQFQQYAQTIGSAISSIFNSVFSVVANDFNNQLKSLERSYKDTVKSIDDETQKRLEAMGLADQTELEKAQEKYDQLTAMYQEYTGGLSELQEAQLSSLEEKITNQTDAEIQEAIRKKREKDSLNNQESIAEAKKELDKQKILDDSNKKKEQAEKDYLKKKSDLEKQAFESKKVNDLIQVSISTALGIINAISSAMTIPPPAGPIIGAINATAVGVAGGVQAGIIASQQYQPAFADGGIVPGSSYTGDRVQARVNSGEMILNNEQQSNLFNQINGGSFGEQVVNIFLDSELVMQKIITGRKFAEVR